MGVGKHEITEIAASCESQVCYWILKTVYLPVFVHILFKLWRCAYLLKS